MQEYVNRLTAVRQKLSTWEVDALLVTSPLNRRWLSGFTGSAGQLLITADYAWLYTDSRYWGQAIQQAPLFTLAKQERRTSEDFQKFLKQSHRGTIGVEGGHVTLTQWEGYKKVPDVSWKVLANSVEAEREIKSEAELESIRHAAAITDHAMSQVHLLAKPGITEKELAWELEKLMHEGGADGLAFETIVASGPNGAMPHHRPSDRPLEEGDAITIDMGALYQGYHSDMTRSFHLGETPSDTFWEIYTLVLKAEQTAIKEMKAGMSGHQIDALARDIIVAAGHGDHFGHSLGHGVGLEIHEGPSLSAVNENPIPVGTTITVEPGVYVPGWSGIRIEDLVLTSANGVEPISKCLKTPLIPINK